MIGLARAARAWITNRLAGRVKVKSSLYYASSSIVCQFLRFAGMILSTRAIHADQFGLFAKATLALSFTMLVRDIGQNNTLASYHGTEQRFSIFNFQINLVLGTAASLTLLSVLATFRGIPAPLRQAAPLLAGITFCEAMVFTAAVVAQRAFRFRLLALGEISAVSSYLITIIALIGKTDGLFVLLWAQFVEGFVRLVLLSVGDRWRFIGWVNDRELRHYYFRRHASYWISQNLLLTLSGRMDYLLLNSFSSVSELGIYERISQFARIPVSLSINLLDRVLFASYSKEQNSPVALLATLRKARRLTLLGATSAAGATTFGLIFVLGKVIGAPWTATILHYWWAALPFSVIVPFVWNQNIVLQSTGNPKQLLLCTVCTAVGELALGSAALAAGLGVSGMFAARTVVYLAVFTLQCVIIRRLFYTGAAAAGA